MAGQIVKRGERSYTVRIFLGRENGKRRYVNKQIRGTRKEAEKYLNVALRDKDLGIFVEPVSITLKDYLKKWLEAAARPRVSRRTADGYAALLDRYITEPLGKLRLDRLQPLDVQKVYGEMQARGLSARVVRHTHSALHNALKQAVKWNMIARNPSDFVELPKVPHKERLVLSPDDALEFLNAADVMPQGLIFRSDVQKVYGEMQARGLSARVVRHTHSALHNALKQAVKWNMIARNPSDFVELPKVPHKERLVLSPDDALEFLNAADVMPQGLIF